ncbi:PIG-L family deacetylase [Streptomyces sp. NPDC006627]|uniref:PIG-L deacetylase family protein n=1 Tax=Streptomyces sp. NPDC006627 TaxID=3154679 RepID=UPI0033B1D2D7
MSSPPLPSLLWVFAHPDDESLLAGGVLAQHHAAGARTGAVTATWAPDSRRAPELADTLAVLGAGPPRLLGYGDARSPESAPGESRLVDAPLDEAIGRLVAHLRYLRPDIVIFPVKSMCSGPTLAASSFARRLLTAFLFGWVKRLRSPSVVLLRAFAFAPKALRWLRREFIPFSLVGCGSAAAGTAESPPERRGSVGRSRP